MRKASTPCFWPSHIARTGATRGWIVGWRCSVDAGGACVVAAIVPTDATARPALELFLRSGGVLDSPIVLGKLGSDATAGGDLCVTSNGVRVATLVHYHQPDWGRCHAHAVRCVGPDGENDDDDMLSSSGTRSAMGTVVDWMNAAYIVERQMRVCYSGGALAAAAAAQIARFAPQFGGGIVSIVLRAGGAEDGALSVPELRKLYAALRADQSAALRAAGADEAEAAAGAKRCLIGQPVQLGGAKHGVLRVALGAEVRSVHPFIFGDRSIGMIEGKANERRHDGRASVAAS